MKTCISQVSNGPKAVGPYSLSVVAEGKFIFVSGQIPFDSATGKIERGSIEEQTQLVLNNLKTIIEASGGKMGNVVNCRVYLSELTPENFTKMNGVYGKFFGIENPPSRSTIGCQLLGFDVEIDCVVAL